MYVDHVNVENSDKHIDKDDPNTDDNVLPSPLSESRSQSIKSQHNDQLRQKYIKIINPKTDEELNMLQMVPIQMLKYTADKATKCRKLKEKLHVEKSKNKKKNQHQSQELAPLRRYLITN